MRSPQALAQTGLSFKGTANRPNAIAADGSPALLTKLLSSYDSAMFICLGMSSVSLFMSFLRPSTLSLRHCIRYFVQFMDTCLSKFGASIGPCAVLVDRPRASALAFGSQSAHSRHPVQVAICTGREGGAMRVLETIGSLFSECVTTILGKQPPLRGSLLTLPANVRVPKAGLFAWGSDGRMVTGPIASLVLTACSGARATFVERHIPSLPRPSAFVQCLCTWRKGGCQLTSSPSTFLQWHFGTCGP